MFAHLGRIHSLLCAVSASLALVACGGGEAPGSTSQPGQGANPGNPVAAQLQLMLSRNKIQTGSSEAVDVTVTAIDSSNRAVAGVPISLATSSGVIEVAATPTTDASGQVKAKLRLGQDRSNRVITITATAGAAQASETLDVSGTTVTLTASRSSVTSPTDVVKLSASLRDASQQPIGNQPVVFATNLGTLAAQTAITNANGLAEVSLSGVTGVAAITATTAGTSGNATVSAQQVSAPVMSPANPTITAFFIQVNPSVIGPNTGANLGNFAELVVSVRGDDPATGARDIPILNAPIKMWIANNPAPGSLAVDTSSSPALTNAAGQATNRFIAGSATTATDGVILCASIVGVTAPNPAAECGANAVATRLTIASQPLFVKVSTNQLIESVDSELNYQKKYSVFVTDAVGRGVGGVSITPRLSPSKGYAYALGHYAFVATQGWVRNGGAARWAVCPNEDENLNAVFEDGIDVDYNGNRVLDPGQVAAVSVDGDGKTDASGVAVVTVKYGKRYATWAQYDLQVRALVGGTEGSATMEFTLPALADDVDDQNVAPPFRASPFGSPSIDYVPLAGGGTGPVLAWPNRTQATTDTANWPTGVKSCRLIYASPTP